MILQIKLTKEVKDFIYSVSDVIIKPCNCEMCSRRWDIIPKNIDVIYLNTMKYTSLPHIDEFTFEMEESDYWVRKSYFIKPGLAGKPFEIIIDWDAEDSLC